MTVQWITANWLLPSKLGTVRLIEHLKQLITVEESIIDWDKFKKLTDPSLNYAPNPRTIRTIYSQFVDTPDIVEERIIRGNRTEINRWESKFQRNKDLPDNISYYDMGIEDRQNIHLDAIEDYRITMVSGRRAEIKFKANTLNDRIFRQSCTIYNSSLYFLHQKTDADLTPPLQFKAEWVAEKLECHLTDASTMVEAWKRLGMNKKAINKMIFGYYDDTNQENRNGLQHIGPKAGREYAEYFEKLANEIDEFDEVEEIRKHFYDVSQRMIDSGEWKAKYYIQSPDAWEHMKWIEYQTMVELDTEVAVWIPEAADEMEGYVSHLGDEEIETTQAAFGANRIFNGNEGIDQELITEIKEASAGKIKIIQRRFFPQPSMWHGKRKPVYSWMTSQQKEKAWKFINARKAELANTPLSGEAIEMLNMLDEIDTIGMKRAMVASFCAGNNFNLYGDKIIWTYKPNKDETFAIWAKFREIEDG